MARCGWLGSRISVECLPVAIGRPISQPAAPGPPATVLTCVNPPYPSLSKQSYHGRPVRFAASGRYGRPDVASQVFGHPS
ncbi:hypothetical protein GCM10027615_54720 [Plantactinospora veratri]